MKRKPISATPRPPRQKVHVARLRFDFTSILETRLLDPIFAPELVMEEENLVKEVRREFQYQVQTMREERKALEPNIVQVAPDTAPSSEDEDSIYDIDAAPSSSEPGN